MAIHVNEVKYTLKSNKYVLCYENRVIIGWKFGVFEFYKGLSLLIGYVK